MNAAVKPLRNATETALIESFEASPALRDAARPSREAAIARFAAVGLPSRRMEPWHYTDLRTLLKQAPPVMESADANDASPPVLSLGGDAQMTFVAGQLVSPAPKRAGLRIERRLGGDLSSGAIPQDDVLLALNNAFALGGADITVDAGAVGGVLHLAFRDGQETAGAFASRIVVRLGAGASLTLVESHESRDDVAHLGNVVVDLEMADNASLTHIRLNAAGDKATSLSTLGATLGQGATFSTVSLTTGAGVSRHQAFVRFAGENANASIRGATLVRGKQHADTTIVLDHASPHCESRELFKTVVDGEATGVFQGRIVVAPHAQKTDARMSSNALLLSEGATMNNKPELEIFADDVQCAHGATCGDLDEDLLFYIMARGLPRQDAEALLLEAFVGDALASVEDEALREALMDRVRAWLAERDR